MTKLSSCFCSGLFRSLKHPLVLGNGFRWCFFVVGAVSLSAGLFVSRSGEHLGAALHGIGEKLFFFIIDVTQWRDALAASQSYVGSAARVSESCEHKGWMRTRIMRMIKDEKHTKGNETRKKIGIRRTLKRNVTINAKCEEIRRPLRCRRA